MNKKRLVLGTKNKDKLRELKRLLSGSKVEVMSLADFKKCEDVIEDGKTFAANAKKKARNYSLCTKSLALADDSGLMVNFLNGKPGVYSARFAGKNCTYHDNNTKLLQLMHGLPAFRCKAKFICVMALYDNGKWISTVKGECHGRIAPAESGKNGFGYDPVFIPDGFTKTFAELSSSDKNKISHRGKALRAAKKVILSYLRKRIPRGR